MRTGSKHDIKDERIDGGKAFDRGRACSISARARAFCRATCTASAQNGRGRISPEQIEQAKKLSQGMGIGYYAMPAEDKIAGMSEDLVLRYSSDWSGAGETMHPIEIPACYKEKFELVHHEEWKLKAHFTRESWNGRMKACRGIGASLTPEEIENWEREHLRMLRENAPEEFDVLHFAAMAELRKKD